jgi:hypothetical protein
MTSNLVVRVPKTASHRAQLLGRLDRLGKGAESLIETDDELLALVTDYAGTPEEAREHFGEGIEVEYHAFSGKVPKAGASEDWEPLVDVGGEIIARPASSREGPPAPPETDAGGGTAPDEGGAPDTADTPSPHLSGAAQAQATADKRKAAKK